MIVFVAVFSLYIFHVCKRGSLISLLPNKAAVNLSRFAESIVDSRTSRAFSFVTGARSAQSAVLVAKDSKLINPSVSIVIGRSIKVADVNSVGGKRGKSKEIEFTFG